MNATKTDIQVVSDTTDKVDIAAIVAQLVQNGMDAAKVDDIDVSAFSALTGGNRTKVRNGLKDAMRSFLDKSDFNGARGANDALKAIEANATKAPEKVDLAQKVAIRVMSLQLAANRLLSGEIHPDGMIQANTPESDIPTKETIAAAIAQIITDADEKVMTDIADNAAKLAQTKASRAIGRNSVEAHVLEILGRNGGKVMTVRNIAKEHSSTYTDRFVSDGAIQARFHTAGTKNYNTDLFVAIAADGREPNRIRLTDNGLEAYEARFTAEKS